MIGIVGTDPQRIVALHNVFAEALVALGLSPIASVERRSGLPSQRIDALKDTASVGSHSEPDFERVLILAQQSEQDDNYDQFSAIAPMLLLDEPDGEVARLVSWPGQGAGTRRRGGSRHRRL